jgi:hypothetical protein
VPAKIKSYFFLLFAVLADFLKALAVGAPLAPTLRMVSPLPALIRFFFAFHCGAQSGAAGQRQSNQRLTGL